MPRPEFKTQLKQRLMATPVPLTEKKWAPSFRWSLRLALASFLVLTLLLAGCGIVIASANSLPDQPLYPVKLATEKVQLVFVRSPVSRARLEARFANRRIEELSQMVKKGKLKEAEEVGKRLNMNLERMGKIAEAYVGRGKAKDKELDELRMLFIQQAAQQPAALEKVLLHMPEEGKPIIARILRTSMEKHAHAIRAIDKPSPQEIKHGMLKGFIRSITENLWIVDGYMIEITSDTIIQGKPEVGRWAKVKVKVKPDGSLQAQRVEIR